MKHLFITLIMSLLLVSCGGDENKDDDLKAEYEYINASNEKINPKEEPIEQVYESPFKEGRDYELLNPPYSTGVSDKVVVYEFFGYTCPHCFYFEPFIEDWLTTKPRYVEFMRVPLNFNQGWADLQQAYLTAEVMGIAEASHSKLFKAIHEEHTRFKSIDELADWYASEIGVNKEEFLSTAGSFIIDSKLRKADKMGAAMKITGTPALIINGKYRIGKNIRNRDEIIQIMRFLAETDALKMGLIKE